MRLVSCLLFLCAAVSASDYTTVGLGKGTLEITVTTSAVVTVMISADVYTVVHRNLQNDGSTASVSTDEVFIMNAYDSAGAAVTMAATHADGYKLSLVAGSAATLNGLDVPRAPDGTIIVQLKAAGHGAKFIFKREQ